MVLISRPTGVKQMAKITYRMFRIVYGIDSNPGNNKMIFVPACDAAAAVSDVMQAFDGADILSVSNIGPA